MCVCVVWWVGREPAAPAEGKREIGGRETPRPSRFFPRAGRGSAAGSPAAEPRPAPGQKEGGGTERQRQVSKRRFVPSPQGAPVARPGRALPLPPSRLPLPWPLSPPVRQSPARRSRPPSPSSRCNGSGAESGAEPSGGSRSRRQALNPLPAGSEPTGSGDA